MYKSSKRNIDFTEGSLFKKLILFAMPIMLTSVLQLIYSLADQMIVGRFSGDPLALAAVGSTASLTSLIVNLFVGISGGTAVLVAQAYGAKDDRTLSLASHTSLVLSLIGGAAFLLITYFVTPHALAAMGTLPELIDSATLYMQIICIGIPASSVFNFCASTLRSVGDSKTPLIILSSTGLINVAFNILFVVGFHMSVDGVALATIISQYASAVWVVIVLVARKEESYSIKLSGLKIHVPTLLRILKYGVPISLQSAMYGISNVVLTSAANSFTAIELSAKTITGSIEGIVYIAMNSYLHATMTLTAQNYGAGKYDRIKRAFKYSVIQVTVIGVAVGALLIALGRPIMSLFIDAADPNKELIIQCGMPLLVIMAGLYFLCGLQETFAGLLRGLGYSVLPMIMSLIGICVVRIVWVYGLFYNIPALKTLIGLFTVYPISWAIAGLALLICIFIAFAKLDKQSKIKEIAVKKG